MSFNKSLICLRDIVTMKLRGETMSVAIEHIEFEGPFSEPLEIPGTPGLFGLVADATEGLELLHIGQCECLSSSLEKIDVESLLLSLKRSADTGICVMTHQMPGSSEEERTKLVSDLVTLLTADSK
jgi:hypothetical protein